jgi:hypothetical protein
MNSVILAFRSSGEGNDGGGGFSAMGEETSCQGGSVATIRLKSDSQTRDLFILGLFRVPTLTLALIYFRNIESFDADSKSRWHLTQMPYKNWRIL